MGSEQGLEVGHSNVALPQEWIDISCMFGCTLWGRGGEGVGLVYSSEA